MHLACLLLGMPLSLAFLVVVGKFWDLRQPRYTSDHRIGHDSVYGRLSVCLLCFWSRILLSDKAHGLQQSSHLVDAFAVPMHMAGRCVLFVHKCMKIADAAAVAAARQQPR
jgi:hypothetical protein